MCKGEFLWLQSTQFNLSILEKIYCSIFDFLCVIKKTFSSDFMLFLTKLNDVLLMYVVFNWYYNFCLQTFGLNM